jgi:hypothetical protein
MNSGEKWPKVNESPQMSNVPSGPIILEQMLMNPFSFSLKLSNFSSTLPTQVRTLLLISLRSQKQPVDTVTLHLSHSHPLLTFPHAFAQ